MVPPRDSDPNSAGLSGLTRGKAHLAAVEAIESRVAEVVGVVHGGHGALVGLAAEALEGRLWEGFGIHSPAQWLAWKSGLSIRVARQLVRVARRRTELPVAVGALEAGELSLDQIHLIAAHVPAAYDEAATELARVTTVAQLERVLPRYAWDDGPASAAEGDASSGDRDGDVSDDSPDDDPDERGSGPGSEGDAEASPLAGDAGSGDDVGTAPGGYRCGGVDGGSGWEERRRGGWWFTEDGFGRLSASLPPDEAMLVDAALKAARADLLSDWRAESGGDGPAPWFNEADALMHIVRAYLAHGRAGGASTDRFLVHAHLEQHPDGTPVMRSHLGPVLPDVLRRYLSCDCDVRPVWEVHGVPLSAGRSQRLVPDRARRLIEHRDGGCVVPGCGRRVGLDVHHIVHWEHGGRTDTSNLCCLCRKHHRQHHLGLLGIEGNADTPDGLIVRDQWGRRMEPSGKPEPIVDASCRRPGGGEDPPVGRDPTRSELPAPDASATDPSAAGPPGDPVPGSAGSAPGPMPEGDGRNRAERRARSAAAERGIPAPVHEPATGERLNPKDVWLHPRRPDAG